MKILYYFIYPKKEGLTQLFQNKKKNVQLWNRRWKAKCKIKHKNNPIQKKHMKIVSENQYFILAQNHYDISN